MKKSSKELIVRKYLEFKKEALLIRMRYMHVSGWFHHGIKKERNKRRI